MKTLLKRLWMDFMGKAEGGYDMPKHAFVLCGDTERWTETAKVRQGDTLLVYPGERIPVDGIITEGASLMEAVEHQGNDTVCRSVGEKVYSGSLNRSGRLKIRALRPAEKSFFQRHLAKATLREATKARAALLLPYHRADAIGSIFPGDLFT